MSPEILRSYLDSNLPAALEMLRRMVEINSFTANPEGVNKLGRYTAECFAPLGFAAEHVPARNPDYGNHLFLHRPASIDSACVAMISHLDTVFPAEEEIQNNFRWQVEGDRIYGPGTQDIKGGTVMMWLVLKTLQEHAPALFNATDWRLFWNAAEERYSPDFGDFCRARFTPDTRAALVFEAEGRENGETRLVVARSGRATWRVSVSGRAAHAGSKHPQGANAVVQLSKMMTRIAGLTDYSRRLTVNPAVIHGGTVLNRVPHEAYAEGEFRAPDPGPYQQARAAILGLAGKGDVASPEDGFPCEIRAEILTETRPWPRNEATDQVYSLWKKAAESLGLPMEPQVRGGLSDGNLIWDAVPTLDGLGPWGITIIVPSAARMAASCRSMWRSLRLCPRRC